MVFLGTVAWFALTIFCLKKGDEWGAGAFILWLIVSFVIAVFSGTLLA